MLLKKYRQCEQLFSSADYLVLRSLEPNSVNMFLGLHSSW